MSERNMQVSMMVEDFQPASEDCGERIVLTDLPLSAKRIVLEDAVPPVPAHAPNVEQALVDIAQHTAQSQRRGPYGVVTDGLLVPLTGGSYVVDFRGGNPLGACKVQVLAYVDPFGRVFTIDAPTDVPPAREPDLSFAQFEHQSSEDARCGCVRIRIAEGQYADLAQYRSVECDEDEDGRYTLFDSWFDFGANGLKISYDEAFGRAYLAFVHRPSLGASFVPYRGFNAVFGLLKNEPTLRAFRELKAMVRSAADDPALHIPALVACLLEWLDQAGVDELLEAGLRDDDLRLVRTYRYANVFYLAPEREGVNVKERQIWALEAALNRFLLVAEALGDCAATATREECQQMDAHVIHMVGAQNPAASPLPEAPSGEENGEWQLRCAIASAMENAKLPLRVAFDMRADVKDGMAALEFDVPDEFFVPEGEAQARTYAMHVALMLAAVAFENCEALQHVLVAARPFGLDAPVPAGVGAQGATGDAVQDLLSELMASSSPDASGAQPIEYFRASFSREDYQSTSAFKEERASNPEPLFERCALPVELGVFSTFDIMRKAASAAFRKRAPELYDGQLGAIAREALCADSFEGIRIQHDSALRIEAERLANRLALREGDDAGDISMQEAIGIVREAESAAKELGSDTCVAAYRRLMAGMVDGSLNMTDQNAIVALFLGENRCKAAVNHARSIAQENPQQAISILADAVAEAEALDGFVDGAVTVHRTFDSYASRLLYNLACAEGSSWCQRAANDAGKQLNIVSDAYYVAHLDLVSLLEGSFEHADDAIRYGKRAIEIAPTAMVGFRTLARAYMLMGDMENAVDVLKRGLLIAVQPTDIAVAYYQLGYAVWRLGDPRAGAACYLKSINTATTVRLQATSELRELMDETGLPMPAPDQIDGILEEAGIPVGPTKVVLDALEAGAAAATDEGLFPVARNLLALRLRYRPDDALTSVLASLED